MHPDHQPNADYPINGSLSWEDISDALGDAIRRQRVGWKRTKLQIRSVEYIIQREDVIRAVKAIQQVDWQNISNDQELALQIRENALHSLATLAQAMRRIELDNL